MKTKFLQSIITMNILAILAVFYIYYIDNSIKAYTWSLMLFAVTMIIYALTPNGKINVKLIKSSIDDIKTYSLPILKSVNYQTFFIIVIALFMGSFVFLLDNVLRFLFR